MSGKLMAAWLLLAVGGWGQQQPSKEYIRLGGRVIAIESTTTSAAPAISLTLPAPNATVSGITTIEAAVTNLTPATVQFFAGSTLLGEDSTAPYSWAWNSEMVSNGSHVLRVKIKDHPAEQAVTVTVNNSGAAFITGSGPCSESNVYYTVSPQWVGMKFTVGAAPLRVTELGRMRRTGNSQSHDVRLYTGSSAQANDSYLRSVSIPMNNGTVGEYVYRPITPVDLAPGQSYYLMSLESSSGDVFCDNSLVTSTSAGTVNGMAWAVVPLGAHFGSLQDGKAVGPLNFKYTTGSAAPAISLTLPAPNATVSGITTIEAAVTNLTPATVQFFAGSTLLGEDSTAPYSWVWNSATVSNGSHVLRVKIKDHPAEQTVTVTVNNSGAVTITPATAQLNNGMSQQFTASTAGAWTLTGGGGSANCPGSVTACTFTAGSHASDQSASLTVTGASTPAAITVKAISVSLTTTSPLTIPPNTSATFQAGILGLVSGANGGMTWRVNGSVVSGVTATAWTWPGSPTPGTYTIQACSIQDPARCGSAVLTVSPPGCTLSVSPTPVTGPEATYTFQAPNCDRIVGNFGTSSAENLQSSGSCPFDLRLTPAPPRARLFNPGTSTPVGEQPLGTGTIASMTCILESASSSYNSSSGTWTVRFRAQGAMAGNRYLWAEAFPVSGESTGMANRSSWTVQPDTSFTIEPLTAVTLGPSQTQLFTTSSSVEFTPAYFNWTVQSGPGSIVGENGLDTQGGRKDGKYTAPISIPVNSTATVRATRTANSSVWREKTVNLQMAASGPPAGVGGQAPASLPVTLDSPSVFQISATHSTHLINGLTLHIVAPGFGGTPFCQIRFIRSGVSWNVDLWGPGGGVGPVPMGSGVISEGNCSVNLAASSLTSTNGGKAISVSLTVTMIRFQGYGSGWQSSFSGGSAVLKGEAWADIADSHSGLQEFIEFPYN